MDIDALIDDLDEIFYSDDFAVTVTPENGKPFRAILTQADVNVFNDIQVSDNYLQYRVGVADLSHGDKLDIEKIGSFIVANDPTRVTDGLELLVGINEA